jgi:hypothetical protein
MFEGDCAETCAGQFPIMSMRGRAEGLACADTSATLFLISIHLHQLGIHQGQFWVTKGQLE